MRLPVLAATLGYLYYPVTSIFPSWGDSHTPARPSWQRISLSYRGILSSMHRSRARHSFRPHQILAYVQVGHVKPQMIYVGTVDLQRLRCKPPPLWVGLGKTGDAYARFTKSKQ